MWSISKGTLFVVGFILVQPQRKHFFPNFSIKYLLMCPEIFLATIPLSPLTNPNFHFLMYSPYWYVLWHLVEQYL